MQQARQTLRLYSPHAGQRIVHQSKSRFNIVCWGRQSGKTTYGINKSADLAWRGPRDGVYWYVLQTYDAADVAFSRVYNFYRNSPEAFDGKPNLSNLYYTFRHGPRVHFKSGKNYEDLRIETLNGAVIDEYRQQHPSLWPMVIRPMLAKKSGWADILSTANGFEHFYDLFESAKLDSEWSWFHAPSTVAPWWTPKEIESARRQMSADEFAQEILAEFRDFHRGKAYINFSQDNIADSFIINHDGGISPHIPILVAMDFNIDPMAWVLGQNRGDNFYFFDELVLKNSNTQEAAKELIAKVRNHPSGVLLIGDATGKARQRAAAGASDYSIIEEFLSYHGIRYENRTPTENPQVKDRINTVNAKLKDALGNIHLWIHPRCVNLIKDFQRVSWKEGATVTLDKTTDKSLTHASDAAGYAICALSSMWNASPGGLRVIIR